MPLFALRTDLKPLLKPILLVLIVLFSFQIVLANLSLAHCHTEVTATESGSTAGVAHGFTHEQDHPADDSHCGDLGFCLFGHCHMHHCSVLVTDASVKMSAILIPSNLGFLKDSQLHSILPLDKPWQPPRSQS
ncbi:MAG: hypothetical protein OM95_00625 [Bdellovibrio sp. ArHS]|uniref:hypothetical protein n=1 Tax=Bdellovibrio sp. ArHS TaxID=1569284 RepID=UPI000583DD2F|nr:hypothetical protein [Bdellovibrio sp. ArHS]KHD90058.1 MAG: hypothetical protein OM95_00625 [Bdellovibrio sp. ArHS]